MTARRTGESQDAAPPPAGSFGETASEMADETFETRAERAPQEPTEVEEPFETPRPSAPQEPPMAPPQSEPGDVLEPDLLVDGAAAEPADPDSEGRDEQLVASYLEQALSERTADLQRLQAEYVNYKRRVDRDRELVRENATYAALAPIVEVLDTIDRAREHGDLDEGFQAVADQLERVVANAGLVKYGEPGDAFDPRLHEALSHIGEDPEVEVTTCKVVAKAGYRIGERVVRAAQVLVVDPASSGG